MGGVWDQVRAMIAEGKGVTVNLKPEWEVKLPRKRTKKPLRTHRNRPWQTYVGSTTGTSRPRCKAKGCENYLLKSQPVACCDAHADQVLHDALRVLALLHYRMVEKLDEFEMGVQGHAIMRELVKE